MGHFPNIIAVLQLPLKQTIKAHQSHEKFLHSQIGRCIMCQEIRKYIDLKLEYSDSTAISVYMVVFTCS